MIKEHDTVALTVDLPDDDLEAGAVGTIVSILGGGEAYMVEFNADDGSLTGLPIVPATAVRPATDEDIARYRKRRPAAAE